MRISDFNQHFDISILRRKMRNQGMAQKTIVMVLDDNKILEKFNTTAKNNLAKILSDVFSCEVKPEYFESKDIQEFMNKCNLRDESFSVHWPSGQFATNTLFRSYRYAFDDTGNVAVEVVSLSGRKCEVWYQKAKDGTIAISRGTVAVNEMGIVMTTTNPSSSLTTEKSIRIYILKNGGKHIAKDFIFGFCTSYTPMLLQPCCANVVLRRAHDIDKKQASFLSGIITEKEVREKHLDGEKIMNALNEIDGKNIKKINIENFCALLN